MLILILTIDDIDEISSKIPVILDMKPTGKFHIAEFHNKYEVMNISKEILLRIIFHLDF